MLSRFQQNLRNKFLLLIAIAFSLILLAVVRGFSAFDQVIEDYNHMASHDVTAMAEISAMNVDFKIQVQEWKNTLIRGAKQDQREKYWAKFNEKADQITKRYTHLLNVLPADQPGLSELKAFASSYPPMIAAYKRGYQAYIESQFDIPTADKAVKGIDRAPTEHLTNAANAVTEYVLSVSQGLTQSASNARTTSTAIMLVAMLAGIALFAWYFSRSILVPLNELTIASTRIARGDLSVTLDVSKRDQLGTLAGNFNLIQRELGGIIGHLRHQTRELDTQLSRLFSDFNSMQSTLSQQAKQTGTLTDNMASMDSQGQDIGNAIEYANHTIVDARKRTDLGQSMFENNVQSGQAMLTAAENAATIIGSLQQNSDDIGNIVNVINGIAEQTNLLALNAAIEAARAGESGRGFAVVADEVRTLATKTQQSTKQISDSIKQLQTSADNAVAAMATGQEQAQQSMSNIRQSQTFISELNEAFAQISDQNKAVFDAVNRQQQQSGSVKSGLNSIAEQSQLTLGQARQMQQVSERITQTLRQISQDIARFTINNAG